MLKEQRKIMVTCFDCLFSEDYTYYNLIWPLCCATIDRVHSPISFVKPFVYKYGRPLLRECSIKLEAFSAQISSSFLRQMVLSAAAATVKRR